MTKALFRTDAYATQARGTVVAITQSGGVILDEALFYPTSGGQPGDAGSLAWAGGTLSVATTAKGESDQVVP